MSTHQGTAAFHRGSIQPWLSWSASRGTAHRPPSAAGHRPNLTAVARLAMPHSYAPPPGCRPWPQLGRGPASRCGRRRPELCTTWPDAAGASSWPAAAVAGGAAGGAAQPRRGAPLDRTPVEFDPSNRWPGQQPAAACCRPGGACLYSSPQAPCPRAAASASRAEATAAALAARRAGLLRPAGACRHLRLHPSLLGPASRQNANGSECRGREFCSRPGTLQILPS